MIICVINATGDGIKRPIVRRAQTRTLLDVELKNGESRFAGPFIFRGIVVIRAF